MADKSVGLRPLTRPPATEVILRPFQEFTRLEAAGGILLAVASLTALVWANSPWRDAYFALWETRLAVSLGDLVLGKPLLKWVNDGLMVVFFFVVGMEIKREVVVGELSDVRKATLPILAAAGGAVLPALAIADDIGAVVIIALFYTPEVAWEFLGVAALFFAALLAANLLGARNPIVYVLLGVGLWFAFVLSGIHATVSGVLLALAIPIRSRIDAHEFLYRGRALLDEFEASGEDGHVVEATGGQREVVQALEASCHHVETPLHRMEHALHPWVVYTILPVFALANAGVTLQGGLGAMLDHPVTMGVALGLVLGKQVGVSLVTWLAVRTGIADLPTGVTWRQIYGAAWLAGIGFTMSLFIAALAYSDPALLDAAKLGVLGGSLVSGVGGWVLLRSAPGDSVS